MRRSLKQRNKILLKEFGQLQCLSCKNIFEGQSKCPHCGSHDWAAYSEINPYTHLPLESLLKLCGHGIWFFSTLFMLFLLWQTNSTSETTNILYISSACFVLFFGIIFSVLYFAIAEVIRRILRIQKRVKNFNKIQNRERDYEDHMLRQGAKQRTSLLQYGHVRREKKNQKNLSLISSPQTIDKVTYS